MYVTYFDEVKSMPSNGQNYYFVGGLAVPITEINEVEAIMNELSEEFFGSKELTTATEFHGQYIYRAKGAFKGKTMTDRVEIFARLAQILHDRDSIKRVYAAINSEELVAKHRIAEFAFAHFCERVQLAMGKNKTCILIGDLDEQEANNMVRDFSKYRANGTPWAYGIEINGIVDSVHFCRSHHSRLIQLADIYLYLETHKWGTRTGTMATLLSKAIEGKNLYAHRYKIWPQPAN